MNRGNKFMVEIMLDVAHVGENENVLTTCVVEAVESVVISKNGLAKVELAGTRHAFAPQEMRGWWLCRRGRGLLALPSSYEGCTGKSTALVLPALLSYTPRLASGPIDA
uniref:Uncharacterized protein n=1 Tax=Ananas comosus var. bracteatus TaxID=296719 RepID=A0A6V7Q911_ANACO|nr:unnamed protein product [Ananas comosus var. bracteatus]